jgi:hypothetical protein
MARGVRDASMIPSIGVLQLKGYSVALLAMCAYGLVASCRSLHRPAPSEYDVILLLGLAFCSFIFIAITVRSPFIGDRTVFGPIALAFASQLAVDFFRPSTHTVYPMRLIIAFLWLVSLVAGVVVLLRRIRIQTVET